MNKVTINKKTPSQVFEELAEFVKTTEKTYQGYDYRKVEDFYNRLWDVCGKENIIITQPQSSVPIYTQLPTGQVICTAYIKVTILDDDGEVFREVGSYGEMELIYSEKTNRFDGIGNIIDVASAKALKLALKKLDVFGNYTLADAEEKKKSSKKSSSKTESEGRFFLKGTDSIVEVRKDSKTGLPVYTWKCSNEGGAFNLIFYPNKYTECGDWMDRLVDATRKKPHTLVNVVAKELAEKDGIRQLMFIKKD